MTSATDIEVPTIRLPSMQELRVNIFKKSLTLQGFIAPDALLVLFFCAPIVHADVDWLALTIDNDMLVGSDSGYTNGLFLSSFDTESSEGEIPDNDFWVNPLLWSISRENIETAANAYTFGQILVTPKEIGIAAPQEGALPYSALLFLTNTYLTISARHADKINTTIGLVGPLALGEEAQTAVHKLTNSDEPRGWDTQLDNELVFQFERARIHRSWVAKSDHFDLLTYGAASLGTVRSTLEVGTILRYGRALRNSFATPLLSDVRTLNPVAMDGGWYVYAGISAGYMFNQIFADGNTFRTSRSIDYDHERIGLSAGLAYSWKNYSLTFAIADSNVTQSHDQSEELQGVTRYGTLTLAKRIQ